AMATCGGSWTGTPDMMGGRGRPQFVGDTTPHQRVALREPHASRPEAGSGIPGRPRSRVAGDDSIPRLAKRRAVAPRRADGVGHRPLAMGQLTTPRSRYGARFGARPAGPTSRR